MNIFSSLYYSYKMTKLQRAITSIGDANTWQVNLMKRDNENRPDLREVAMDEYLDLCESKPAIRDAMEQYRLDRFDLKEIYWSLLVSGCSRWAHGHHIALSSLIFVEPLLYCVDAKMQGKTPLEIGADIVDYWQNKRRNGFLIYKLNEAKCKLINNDVPA